MSAKGKIARAAGLMSIATFMSRILGYVRDMIIAGFFGASGSADVFYVAFRVPNLLRELFAEGSMSSAFVPVLTEYQTKYGFNEAKRLVQSTFLFILVALGLICAAGMVFAPAIVSVIAPGFVGLPDKFADTVLLTRLMFPFLLFISLAALVMGALNTRGVFFIPALAPATLNIVSIISVTVFASRFTNPLIAAAVGVTAGGLVQFLFQLPSFFRQGYSFFSHQQSETAGHEARKGEIRKSLTDSYKLTAISSLFLHPGLKKIGLLIIPTTAGLAVAQINIFVSTILASYLPEGSITYLYYAMRLIQFPIGIFGVAMGMAVLPALSEHAVRGEKEKLKDDFSFALRLLFFITVPAMAGLIALKTPIVHVLFQRGAFGYDATVNTADALMFYSLGIWAVVGAKVTASTFYSLQDTRTPVKTAAVAMVTNIGLSLLLMGWLKHNGLALANAMASGVNFLLLFYFLRKRLGGIGAGKIAISFVKILTASTAMGVAGWFCAGFLDWQASSNGMQKALLLGGLIVLCVAVYALVCYLLKIEEMRYCSNRIGERIGKRRSCGD